MNKILSVVRSLVGRGAVIVGVEYDGSPNPVKNVRLGDKMVADPPYGVANGPAEFTHNGRKYIRTVDHNDGETVKILAIDKIQSITVDGVTTIA